MVCALPNDVLLMVGEQLDQQTDRWNLIFVSRQFHDLFLSLVYRNVSLQHWRGAYSFLHSITKRPSLTKAVRGLDSSGWQTTMISDIEREELKSTVAVQESVTALTHSQEETEQWKESLGKGPSDAWIALLLPQLSQLRQLHVAHAAQAPFLTRIMKRAVSRQHPFSSQAGFQYLREVSLYRYDDTELLEHHEQSDDSVHLSSDLLLPFFQLPSMRTIVANSVIDPSPSTRTDDGNDQENENDNEDTQSSPTYSSSITEIDFRLSSGNHGMHTLIASCAGLESLKYQHSDAHLQSHGYQPAAFYRSLSHSKQTLQILWLDHYGEHYPFTAAGLNQTHDEWFGSLADFTSLRELRIRLPNLLDLRYRNEPTKPLLACLPSSLETLYIEGCEERHVSILASQLQTVIKNHRARMPNLRRVDIEGPFRNVAPDSSEEASAMILDIPDNSIKIKVLQAAEPLHVDCITAGVELHLYDRACAQICDV